MCFFIVFDLRNTFCYPFSKQQSTTNQSSSDCPIVLGVEDTATFSDGKTLFLPVHDSINLTVKGRGLLKVRCLVIYNAHYANMSMQHTAIFKSCKNDLFR